MRVLIADALPGEVRVELANLGLSVDFRPSLTADDLPSEIPDAHILVVRSTKVSDAAITAANRLQLIIRAGAGTNTIDCAAAARNGVFVANCPGKNSLAVAELTLGMILALDRRIPDNVADVRARVWNKKKYSKARGLYGRTLGVVGLGRIGSAVVERARAFGLNCLAWDKVLQGTATQGVDATLCTSLMELCSRVDILTLHVPLTPETQHLIGADELASMRQGALLLNMSRGGVVDDRALAEAVRSGRIRAASDVYEQEPRATDTVFDTPFADLEGFYGTHHIGASTEQAQSAVAEEVVNILRGWLATGQVMNCVNVSAHTPAVGQLVVRHLDRIGVLARVLDVLKEARINVQEMQNTVFEGALAASAKITVQHAPTDDVIAAVTACQDVLGVEYLRSR